MSPALQGNLEVERYIGSCLISQRVPPNVKAPVAKRYQNHQHQKPKNSETEKAPRNFNKYCFPQRDHHVGGPPRYSMPPMPVDCQGYANHNHRHNPGGSGSGWAGVPLISMTSGNPRRNKKILPTSNAHHSQQKYPNKQTQQNCYKSKDLEDNFQADSDRSPLTKLAIHTQGAPLIQAGRFNNNNRCRNNFSREQATRVYRSEGAKTPASAPSKEQPVDSCSVASDESSANSENSLPRIIKPRKRRKKDRKPITGATPGTPTTPTAPSVESSPVPAYLPIRYEQNIASGNAPGNTTKDNTPDLLTHNGHVSSLEDKSEDLIDPLTSADEFPFGNLLDDEEDREGEGTPATLCQCRYCDPSGVIWDVEQRCYSPFLTPPSPTANPLPQSSQFGFGGDLVSLLRRSWSDPSPYTRTPETERPLSPGLQVSSEIVTSHNGHRDIEIKFFSSSSPPDSSRVKFCAVDRDPSDRCFVAEE